VWELWVELEEGHLLALTEIVSTEAIRLWELWVELEEGQLLALTEIMSTEAIRVEDHELECGRIVELYPIAQSMRMGRWICCPVSDIPEPQTSEGPPICEAVNIQFRPRKG
jgi:hypothetical protein